MSKKLRLGIISKDGKFGYSIRTKAFINVLKSKTAYDLFPINQNDLIGNAQPSIINALYNWLRWGKFGQWKEESFIEIAAQNLDRYIEKNRLDFIQAETLTSAHIWLRSKKKCPCILDMHGLTCEEKELRGKISSNNEMKYWYSLQKEALHECARIFVVSEKMKKYVLDINPNANISILPNASYPCKLKAEYKYPITPIYAGIFEYWENVEDFMALSKDSAIYNHVEKFSLIGDGRLKSQILSMVNNHIKYYGRLSRFNTFLELSKSQIGVIPSTSDITRQVASPIKLFDYLSVGLPVLTVDVGEWSSIVMDFDCGIVVENTPKDLANGLLEFLDNARWNSMSENAKRLIVDRYNWDSVISKTAFPVYNEMGS